MPSLRKGYFGGWSMVSRVCKYSGPLQMVLKFEGSE